MTLGPRLYLQRCHDGTYVVWQQEGARYTDGRGHYANRKQVRDLPEYVSVPLAESSPVVYPDARIDV